MKIVSNVKQIEKQKPKIIIIKYIKQQLITKIKYIYINNI